jgi:hypothetical protein
MIFVPDTPPAIQLKFHPPQEGDEWHVLGIPRLSLEAISSWAKAGGAMPRNENFPTK